MKHIYRVGNDHEILTLQSFKSPTTGKEIVFRGSFDEKHLDEKATLLNGVIEYKQQEHYGTVASLIYFTLFAIFGINFNYF